MKCEARWNKRAQAGVPGVCQNGEAAPAIRRFDAKRWCKPCYQEMRDMAKARAGANPKLVGPALLAIGREGNPERLAKLRRMAEDKVRRLKGGA